MNVPRQIECYGMFSFTVCPFFFWIRRKKYCAIKKIDKNKLQTELFSYSFPNLNFSLRNEKWNGFA